MNEIISTTMFEYRSQIRHFPINSRWLYEGELRIGATSYAEGASLALNIIQNSTFPKEFIRKCVSNIFHPTENQARSNFKRIWVNRSEGIPYLSAREIFYFKPEEKRFLSKKMRKLSDLQIKEKVILLSRSGTTGFPILVCRKLSKFAITDDALRILPGDIPIGYIYAFLASKYGHTLITKNEYGATVSHLEADHIKNIPLPLAPNKIQKTIHKKIIEAYELREKANDLLNEAEGEFYNLLNINHFSDEDIEYFGTVKTSRTFSAQSAELTDRIDASHHIPLVRSCIRKLEKSRFPLVPLQTLIEDVFLPPRFSRTYVQKDYGIPFIQGRQLPLFRIHGLKYISQKVTKDINKWIIMKDWVLITRSGTIGRVGLVTRKMERWAASEHLLRIKPIEGVSHPGFLLLFLESMYGQHQLCANIYGGVVDELTADDTKSILIPQVPWDDQRLIGEIVINAYELRDIANEKEDQAIKELEELIENSN